MKPETIILGSALCLGGMYVERAYHVQTTSNLVNKLLMEKHDTPALIDVVPGTNIVITKTASGHDISPIDAPGGQVSLEDRLRALAADRATASQVEAE